MRTSEHVTRPRPKIAIVILVVAVVLLAVWFAMRLVSLRAESAPGISGYVERAILAEDWTKVTDLLGTVDGGTVSCVPRLVKAHACLALNRNNESLCLFLSVSSQDELSEWKRWTQNFAGRNPKKAIAQYFRGDGLARLKQWDSALAAFNQALDPNSAHALALNSRGIVYAAREQWNEALLDFVAAAEAQPSFADAYASRGTLSIQRQEGPTGAVRAFSRALEIEPDFALARVGRAAVEMVLGKWDEAEKDLKRAQELCKAGLETLHRATLLNAAALAEARSEAARRVLLVATHADPGMGLDTLIGRFDNLSSREQQVVAGAVLDAAAHNGAVMDLLPDAISLNVGPMVGVGPSGPMVGMGVGGSVEFNPRERTQNNLDWQQPLLDHALRKGVEPADMTGLGAWGRSRPGHIAHEFTHPQPGGVSSEEFAYAPLDTGEWNAYSLYGLAYNFREGNAQAAQQPKLEEAE